MERFSRASSRASILVSTVAVRDALSGWSGVCEGLGSDVCVSPSPCGFGLEVSRIFFLGPGVGEGSTRVVGWGVGPGCRPRGAGELEGVPFAARGRLCLVALGVTDADWVGFGLDPDAVRLRPAVGVGVSVRKICRPSFSAVSIK